MTKAGEYSWGPMTDGPLTFREYQEYVDSRSEVPEPIKDSGGSVMPVYATGKLAGETGELSELIFKTMRPGSAPLDKVKAILELGDVQWYVNRIARILGTDGETTALLNREKLRRRKAFTKDPVEEWRLAHQLLTSKGVVL